MKYIISLILITFALISLIISCDCARDARKFRLSHVFENINEKKSKNQRNELENEISKAVDMKCVKNFFNLPQNNKMIVSQVEELIFTIAANMKCSDEGKAFQRVLDEFIFKGLKRRLNCLKWILQKHEPESKLLENFEINENDTKECSEKFSTVGIVEMQADLEKALGPLSVYSCEAVTGVDDYVKFLAKGVIILYGDINEELREAEMKKLREYFKDIAVRTVDCNVKRFKDDPKAYSINDSLNYFYTKYIEDLNLHQTKDYNIALMEAAINHNCVKEKLNLPENGEKSLLKIESKVLLALAKSKCIKSDLIEFLEIFLKILVPNYFNTEENVVCIKLELQKLEPTSKLVENFTNNGTECSTYNNIHPFGIYRWDYEMTVGLLNETTCGVLTEDIVNVIDYKTFLVANEINEELKRSEIQELFAMATEKLQELADCILKKGN